MEPNNNISDYSSKYANYLELLSNSPSKNDELKNKIAIACVQGLNDLSLHITSNSFQLTATDIKYHNENIENIENYMKKIGLSRNTENLNAGINEPIQNAEMTKKGVTIRKKPTGPAFTLTKKQAQEETMRFKKYLSEQSKTPAPTVDTTRSMSMDEILQQPAHSSTTTTPTNASTSTKQSNDVIPLPFANHIYPGATTVNPTVIKFTSDNGTKTCINMSNANMKFNVEGNPVIEGRIFSQLGSKNNEEYLLYNLEGHPEIICGLKMNADNQSSENVEKFFITLKIGDQSKVDGLWGFEYDLTQQPKCELLSIKSSPKEEFNDFLRKVEDISQGIDKNKVINERPVIIPHSREDTLSKFVKDKGVKSSDIRSFEQFKCGNDVIKITNCSYENVQVTQNRKLLLNGILVTTLEPGSQEIIVQQSNAGNSSSVFFTNYNINDGCQVSINFHISLKETPTANPKTSSFSAEILNEKYIYDNSLFKSYSSHLQKENAAFDSNKIYVETKYRNNNVSALNLTERSSYIDSDKLLFLNDIYIDSLDQHDHEVIIFNKNDGTKDVSLLVKNLVDNSIRLINISEKELKYGNPQQFLDLILTEKNLDTETVQETLTFLKDNTFFIFKTNLAKQDSMPNWFIANLGKEELVLVMHNPNGNLNDKNYTQVQKISLIKPGLSEDDLRKLGVKDSLIEKYQHDGGFINSSDFNIKQLNLLQANLKRVAFSSKLDRTNYGIRLQEYLNNCSMVINGQPKGLELKYQITAPKKVAQK